MEVYKKIKLYPNYEISSYGKVKNITTNKKYEIEKTR